MKKVWLVALLALAAGVGTTQAQNAFLPNPSFETADTTPGDNVLAANWFNFSQSGTLASALDTSIAFHGNNSMRFDNSNSAGTFQGSVAFGGNGFVDNGAGGIAEFMPTTVGTPITFSGRVLESASAFNGVGKLQLEWADSTFNVFQRDFVQWNGTGINASTWTPFSITQAAPTGTSYVKFVLVNETAGAGSAGSFYVDSVQAIPEPSTVAMLALGSLMLAGLVIRRRK